MLPREYTAAGCPYTAAGGLIPPTPKTPNPSRTLHGLMGGGATALPP